ncbi:Predicted metal-dependent hydrolase, TIM-barrel fold [Variovorax sp. YR266]|uniref:amidohydrolase family protein n=1 Tax=Variovorax sp. YR266 TaxID=1884386 RepID=UPI000897AF1A|nr:amidohydrolase family protein [Variovorax sp. YR266]SDZ70370.1 Predicted metal-dependent hydrolase, TIM-barrel fold [Variovorax sp. YR266]
MAVNPTAIFRGNRPRDVRALAAWHALAPREPALEPGLPIVDAHHHLYGSAADAQHYRAQDLAHDLAEGGHRVIGTVYIEAFGAGWRTDGLPELRSLGEVETVVRVSAPALQTPQGACQLGAGIVSNVDLCLGDAVVPVLEAHLQAGQGRLRGVRHHATHDSGPLGRFTHNASPHLLGDSQFRRGLGWLSRFGLSFDALVFHTQLDELAALVDAFPDTRFILNHGGIALGVAPYDADRRGVFAQWQHGVYALAERPNVSVKIGGMGMLLCGFGFERGELPPHSDALVRAWRPFIDACTNAFGSDRCMFESNFPVDKQSCSYAALWNAFKRCTSDWSVDERRSMFYRTACRAYRLPDLAVQCDGIAMPPR